MKHSRSSLIIFSSVFSKTTEISYFSDRLYIYNSMSLINSQKTRTRESILIMQKLFRERVANYRVNRVPR